MLTPLGRALRRLRLDRNMLLKDMADGIGVSPSFLSAVENGRKPLPVGLLLKIRNWAGLTEDEMHGLKRAADESTREVKIRAPDNLSTRDREALAILARKFGELDEEKRRLIRAMLLDG